MEGKRVTDFPKKSFLSKCIPEMRNLIVAFAWLLIFFFLESVVFLVFWENMKKRLINLLRVDVYGSHVLSWHLVVRQSPGNSPSAAHKVCYGCQETSYHVLMTHILPFLINVKHIKSDMLYCLKVIIFYFDV